MNRGDVVLVDLEPEQGAQADKARSAVPVGNDDSLWAALLHGCGVVTIVLVTSDSEVTRPDARHLRSARFDGLRTPSKAQAEQVRSVDVGRVLGSLGRLGPSDLDALGALDDALRYHLAARGGARGVTGRPSRAQRRRALAVCRKRSRSLTASRSNASGSKLPPTHSTMSSWSSSGSASARSNSS